jgi:hypothetical protein
MRIDTTRDSGAWAANLARHVEQRHVSPGQTAAWCIIGLCLCFVVGASLAARVWGLP